MATDCLITYAGSDLDGDFAYSSAIDAMHALAESGTNSEVASLESLTPAMLHRCNCVFLCDSTPCPQWAADVHGAKLAGLKAYLESERIPYTGSTAKATASAKWKLCAKEMVVEAGLDTPKAQNVREHIERPAIDYPIVLKPMVGSASNNVVYLEGPADFRAMLERVNPDDFFLEEYVAGSEVTVGVVEFAHGLKVLSPLKIEIEGMIFDAERKTKRPFPPVVTIGEDDPLHKDVTAMAATAFSIIGCRGYARVDARVSAVGIPYFLEVNTAPRLGRNEYMGMAGKRSGIEYSEMINEIFMNATRRLGR